MARGVRIHQRRLRQADKSPGRRIEHDKRQQQQPKLVAYRSERKRERKEHAAIQHQNTSLPDIAENADKRLDHTAE